MNVLYTIGERVSNASLMLWTVWWALVLGLAVSGALQAWSPPERIERALGGHGARPLALASATGFGSPSRSYAAIAIARALFERGASLATAAFIALFARTLRSGAHAGTGRPAPDTA